VISKAILLYENLIEQQDKAHGSTLEQREVSKDWILSKSRELEQVREAIKKEI
jgi:hypothetical protein